MFLNSDPGVATFEFGHGVILVHTHNPGVATLTLNPEALTPQWEGSLSIEVAHPTQAQRWGLPYLFERNSLYTIPTYRLLDTQGVLEGHIELAPPEEPIEWSLVGRFSTGNFEVTIPAPPP